MADIASWTQCHASAMPNSGLSPKSSLRKGKSLHYGSMYSLLRQLNYFPYPFGANYVLFSNKSFKPFWDFTEKVLSRFKSEEQGACFSAVQHQVKPTWETMLLWRAGFDPSTNITQTADCCFRNGCFPLWQLPYW